VGMEVNMSLYLYFKNCKMKHKVKVEFNEDETASNLVKTVLKVSRTKFKLKKNGKFKVKIDLENPIARKAFIDFLTNKYQL
jgi:hypothetical protein